MPHFRKRPLVVEAVQWTGENLDEVRGLLGADEKYIADAEVRVGDWIFRSPSDELNVLSASDFDGIYEPIAEGELLVEPEVTVMPDGRRSDEPCPVCSHLLGEHELDDDGCLCCPAA